VYIASGRSILLEQRLFGKSTASAFFQSEPTLLNRAIEIHDSVLESVSMLQGRAELHFSRVYLHQSEGKPGHDPGSIWVQRAILRICDAKVTSAFSEFPVDLAGGHTRMGRDTLENEIPVPLRHAGRFEIRLQPMWEPRNVVSFEGSKAELDLIGEPDFIKEFRPKEKS
jgi:hypothetical protein